MFQLVCLAEHDGRDRRVKLSDRRISSKRRELERLERVLLGRKGDAEVVQGTRNDSHGVHMMVALPQR